MTIKEARLAAGMSREDLAERVGATARMLKRWEEVGLDAEPGSILGDYFVHKIMQALGLEEGLVFPYVPDSPRPGDFIITPTAEAESLMEGIIERAEELGSRMFVPDEFGGRLVPPKDLTEEDEAEISEHFDRERRYSEAVVRRMEATLDMLGGNSGEWKPGQTVGERLEEAGRELGAELERKTKPGGDE